MPFFIGPFWFVPKAAWRLDHHTVGQSFLGAWYTLQVLIGFGVVAWLVTRPESGPGHRDVADDEAREVVAAG